MTPAFPPLAPSARWFAKFLRHLMQGDEEKEAIMKANSESSDTKDFSRFVITDNKGDKLVLSSALAGGGRQLKKRADFTAIRLSEHGDWRKIHLGAFESVLGKKPFYRHLEPWLKEIYDFKSRSLSCSDEDFLQFLEEFNTAIFKMIYSFLMKNIRPEALKTIFTDPVLKARGKEVALQIDADVSLVQTLSSIGQEALLGIVALE